MMTLKTDLDHIASDAAKLHDIVHGTDTQTVSTDGGPVKSVAKAIKDISDTLLAGGTGAVALATAQAVRAEQARDAALGYRDGAEDARDAAQGYASLAQATNPLAALQINADTITTNQTLAAGYNALSAGPIDIADGVTVTIEETANWSIA